tara:strand:+ start:3032 stop:3787 length:756 start_codon:yes stop_codon:yes gene_type:complete
MRYLKLIIKKTIKSIQNLYYSINFKAKMKQREIAWNEIHSNNYYYKNYSGEFNLNPYLLPKDDDELLKFLSNNHLYKMMSKYVTIDNNTVVLDLGCGYGRFVEFYAAIASFVYAIDVTDYIIDICKTKYAGIKNVAFIKNNGYSLEMIDDSSIDLVSCYTVFQHIPRKATQSYLKEFSRIIKPNGRIIIQLSGAQSNNDKRYNDVGLDKKDYKIQYTKEDIKILAMRSKLELKKIDEENKGDGQIWYWVTM